MLLRALFANKIPAFILQLRDESIDKRKPLFGERAPGACGHHLYRFFRRTPIVLGNARARLGVRRRFDAGVHRCPHDPQRANLVQQIRVA